MKKKIISFSLWGDNGLYNVGSIVNARLSKSIYAGWIPRFYVDKKSPSLTRIKSIDHVEVVEMEGRPDYSNMVWRMFAADDLDADYIVFRDCDSRLNWREKAAVESWIESEKDAHVMRDCHIHAHMRMLGGMWGIKGGILTDIRELCSSWNSSHDMNRKINDEDFLKERIWPRIKRSVLIHGYGYVWGGEDNALDFPRHPPFSGIHVGEVVQPSEEECNFFHSIK